MREKYGTLDRLNAAWWTGFWSQRYTDWDQIEPPSSIGQGSNTSMKVDWRRFTTQQCKDFLTMERDTVKAVNPELLCTANLMERFWDYDYFSWQRPWTWFPGMPIRNGARGRPGHGGGFCLQP